MEASSMIARIRAQREQWVDLGAGKRVKVRRPAEAEFGRFIKGKKVVANVAEVCDYVVGWDGFTEADLLGTAGGEEPVAFSPELWAEVVKDRLAWVTPVARALVQSIGDHRFSLNELEKN